MRSSDEIKKIILDKANNDSRVRAVLLNGSRANNKVEQDQWQDFDIVYIVTEVEAFTANHSWVDIFGERLIWQLPDEMDIYNGTYNKTISFHYLMLFKDGNRIDLTLFPKDKLDTDFKLDSLTIVWLDKDNLFTNIEAPCDKDYLIKQPTQQAFSGTCNEFWWVCTYVSKGLLRNQITYAKAMLEYPVRQMFMHMTEWYIGTKTNFSVSFGKDGKDLQQYLSPSEYKKVLTTYADYNTENIWQSLFVMTDIFQEYAQHVAQELKFSYNHEEQQNAVEYLHEQHNQRK